MQIYVFKHFSYHNSTPPYCKTPFEDSQVDSHGSALRFRSTGPRVWWFHRGGHRADASEGPGFAHQPLPRARGESAMARTHGGPAGGGTTGRCRGKVAESTRRKVEVGRRCGIREISVTWMKDELEKGENVFFCLLSDGLFFFFGGGVPQGLLEMAFKRHSGNSGRIEILQMMI